MITDELKQNSIVAALLARSESAVVDGKHAVGEITLVIDPAQIVNVCNFLKHDEKFVRLSGITGVDWYPVEPRFEVVYHLHSIERNLRLRLKCQVHGEAPEIDSVTPVWKGAGWYERETFDLFGVRFRNHPDLTRIMMPDTWEGHPLRKDYPVHGHKYDYANE